MRSTDGELMIHVDILNERRLFSFRMPKEVLQGTLDLMVLRTLETMGPQHGFGLAKRILQISEGILGLNQGTLYPALLRLEQRGWIKSQWGISDNKRQAKFYELTTERMSNSPARDRYLSSRFRTIRRLLQRLMGVSSCMR